MKKFEPFIINRHVNFNQVKLLDANKNFHNSISIGQAKEMAKTAALDLVCFSEPEKQQLAFCKILDYGKWKYIEDKKLKKMKSASKKITKELRFTIETDSHDIEHKIKQAKGFFEDGDDVILSMRLKGRQRGRKKEALEKMENIVTLCGDVHETYRQAKENFITIRLSPGTLNPKGGKNEENTQ